MHVRRVPRNEFARLPSGHRGDQLVQALLIDDRLLGESLLGEDEVRARLGVRRLQPQHEQQQIAQALGHDRCVGHRGGDVSHRRAIAMSVFDGLTGDLIGTVAPGEAYSGAIADVLPDSRTVLISSWDGAHHTWDASPAHWIDFACEVAGRNLRADEWRDAFGDRPYRPTCPAAG